MSTPRPLRGYVVFFALLVMIMAGCGGEPPRKTPPQEGLVRLSPDKFPRFEDSNGYADLSAAIDQSLSYFKRVPQDRTYRYGKESYDASHMILTLDTFRSFLLTRPSAPALNAFIRDRFFVYKSTGRDNGEVLFTGYYEPTYPGSLSPGPDFPYPLYSVPTDLFKIDLSKFSDKFKGAKRLMARVDVQHNQILPYWERSEINANKDFSDQARPVVWLASRVDRFFLEIQGSGRVVLPDGGEMRIHYAGTNGNAYTSVGKYLIDHDEIPKEKMSMQAIRQWLEDHPGRMDEVLHTNKSFVFFKEGEGGPFGSIGVAVTPLRSIATDPTFFPRGALGFAQAALPSATGQPKETWLTANLFVLNQDTGGAIKGPGRADLFCGNGDFAEFTAGHMTSEGSLYFLVLKP